ncbi:hypothetical protein NP603_06275 [Methylomonas sp. SURF-1]|uniref:HNH endonuclease n=1 Tax=Methylomonas aurea TaxID=2952224 RepID=A0ABT1UEP2_9GAMM|nr:hypothetical protein [Methylomonas sp. SURF-1]MCQ8180705.1 hypothetical protein [Methylomonas sp. SURF-1]
MSQSKNRKQQFLSANPVCCFCGGVSSAQEPDHVPSRAFFTNRQWPEGYEFPACVDCNRASRHDEQVVAMLSRLYPESSNPADTRAMEKLMEAVSRNYPEVIEELLPTLRQKRNAAKKYKLELQPGQTHADLPLLSVSGPIVNSAIRSFSRKLFCVLYYKHAGQILKRSGGIALLWFSNLQIEEDNIPRELADVLSSFPKLERSRINLDDQFFYRWAIANTKEIAVFLTFFRRSFAILGYVHQHAERFELPPGFTIIRPFQSV